MGVLKKTLQNSLQAKTVTGRKSNDQTSNKHKLTLYTHTRTRTHRHTHLHTQCLQGKFKQCRMTAGETLPNYS